VKPSCEDSMLTLFTTLKAIRGHVGVIQENALSSWARLEPRPQVIIVGNDPGVTEMAKRLGVDHIPEVATSSLGTPLISDIFRRAEAYSAHDLMCYVNADIILTNDFMSVATRMKYESDFLVVGRRTDVEINTRLEFRSGWEDQLRRTAQKSGRLHPAFGIDYFLYRRYFFGRIPDFAVGRTAWDNWLIYRALAVGGRVIDATHAVLAVHQNHDYQHHAQGESGVWSGEEARSNRRLAGGWRAYCTLDDATHLLDDSGLRRNYSPRRLSRSIQRQAVIGSGLQVLNTLIRKCRRIAARVRRRQ